MVVGWLLLMSVLSNKLASASNVTGAYEYNDECTIQCDDNDNTHWCRERRKDAEGFLSRCQSYTKNGRPCVGKCIDDRYRGYSWCMTNSKVLDSYGYWGYCSLEGFTINREKCVDACEYRAAHKKRYYHCHTRTSWDYCSPPARVKPLQLNTKGSLCRGECAHHGEEYTWCKRNVYYWKSGTTRYDWEYCSIDSMHTSDGKQCKDSCSRRGESYYWCNTEDGWGYCSVKAEEGLDISLKVELDIYGGECFNLCDTHGEDYFWCVPIGGYRELSWEYCSKGNMTIYNSPCRDSCARRGEAYHWCHTASSWDYCSPTKAPSTGAAAQGSVIVLAMGIIARITARNI